MDFEKYINSQINCVSEVVNLNTDAGQREVYRAKHEKYGDIVIKVVKEQGTEDRVLREIEVNKENRLENVPKLYEDGYLDIDNNKYLYMIEQFIEGDLLRKVLIDDKN